MSCALPHKLWPKLLFLWTLVNIFRLRSNLARQIAGLDGRRMPVPEYESCRAAALAENIHLKLVCDMLIEEMRDHADTRSGQE